MITVGQLKDICEAMEKEWGSDGSVYLRLHERSMTQKTESSEITGLTIADSCLHALPLITGNLILSNFKE